MKFNISMTHLAMITFAQQISQISKTCYNVRKSNFGSET